MKKIFISLLTIAMAINVMAVNKTYLRLTSNDNKNCDVTLLSSEDYAATFAETSSSLISMEGRAVAAYITYNSKDYQIFAAKELWEDMPITIVTNASTSYKFSISLQKGTPETLFLYDAVENQYMPLTSGSEYAFTAAANQTIADRFMLKKKPAEPTICHQYGNLIITGHQGAKVKVLDMADQVAIAEQTLATDDEVISLSELTSGEMYQVVMDEEVMLIRIQ